MVWRWYNKKYNETNTIRVYKNVVGELGDNCIVATATISKENWLMKFWQSISVLGPKYNNDVNVVDILKYIW